MRNIDPKQISIPVDAALHQALSKLNETGHGFLLVVDGVNRLLGSLTDGDVRRYLAQKRDLDQRVRCIANIPCLMLPMTATDLEIEAVLSETISFVPLVDGNGVAVEVARARRHRRFPLMEPDLRGNELEYVMECVETGWISSQGRFVGLFESAVARFHGYEDAVSVSSGTTALHLALEVLRVGPGDEVIVPDLTFAASANAVMHAGADPVLADIDPQSWTLDPASVRKLITERTRAIMPVHLYGHPCNMDPLLALAEEFDLFIIEDCAEAFGARCKGQLTGTFGDAACFSFFANKTITTGEGGMLLFKDPELNARARLLRDHGMQPSKRYWHEEVGYNYRMTNLQAAVGVAQMERIESILERKRQIALNYTERLAEIPLIELPFCAEWAEHAHWLYTVQVAAKSGLERDGLLHDLLAKGVETRPVFHPLHTMPPFRACARAAYPIATEISRRGISLPSAVNLSMEDITEVAEAIEACINGAELVR